MRGGDGAMYYPLGLPRRLRVPGGADHGQVKAIVCNRDRVLFAVLTEKSIWIWFSRVSNTIQHPYSSWWFRSRLKGKCGYKACALCLCSDHVLVLFGKLHSAGTYFTLPWRFLNSLHFDSDSFPLLLLWVNGYRRFFLYQVCLFISLIFSQLMWN